MSDAYLNPMNENFFLLLKEKKQNLFDCFEDFIETNKKVDLVINERKSLFYKTYSITIIHETHGNGNFK